MSTKPTINRATEINQLHDKFCEGLRTTLQHAIKCGELLVAQKEECKHGSWIPWLKANVKFNKKTANQYMRCYRKREMLNETLGSHLTLADAARLTSKPTQEELNELAQRDKELDELAEIEAKKRIAAEAKEREIAEEKTTLEAEVVEINDEEEFEDFDSSLAELAESKEAFEKRVQDMIAEIKASTAEDRNAAQIPDKNLGKEAKKIWEAIYNHEPNKAADRKRLAKVVIKMLLKKYPGLMDEVLEK